MKRTMLQLNLTNCDAAIELYVKAFGATIEAIQRAADSDMIMHAEITAFGQCISFSESVNATAGNTMQFCFHFGEGNENKVTKAYEVLKDGATIDMPLGECDWSPCIFSLVDKFGVYWCLFV